MTNTPAAGIPWPTRRRPAIALQSTTFRAMCPHGVDVEWTAQQEPQRVRGGTIIEPTTVVPNCDSHMCPGGRMCPMREELDAQDWPAEFCAGCMEEK